jgi:hypothetical protein
VNRVFTRALLGDPRAARGPEVLRRRRSAHDEHDRDQPKDGNGDGPTTDACCDLGKRRWAGASHRLVTRPRLILMAALADRRGVTPASRLLDVACLHVRDRKTLVRSGRATSALDGEGRRT